MKPLHKMEQNLLHFLVSKNMRNEVLCYPYICVYLTRTRTRAHTHTHTHTHTFIFCL